MSATVHTLCTWFLAGAWLGGVVFTTFVVSPALKAIKWGKAVRRLLHETSPAGCALREVPPV